MKSFLDLLTEAKDRFIKKNKNLTKDQQEELIAFFRSNNKAEKDVEKEYGWQRGSSSMTYDDFVEIMNRYKGGRKALAKSKKVKCPDNLKGLTKNKDYVHLKIRHPEYCAYIPLSHDTAQKFNGDKVIGTCSGPWCIGHSSMSKYYKLYTKRNGRVPVYIVGRGSKWVVMIDKNNSSMEIWDVTNDHGSKMIPGFNARKELIDSKKAKLYDQVRDEFLQKTIKAPEDIPQHEFDDAVESYELMASDLEDWVARRRESEEYHWNEMRTNIDNTIEKYQEWADDAEQEAKDNVGDTKQRENLRDRINSFEGILKAEPQGTGTDPKTGEPVWHIRGTEPSKRQQRSLDFKRDYLKGTPSEINREGVPYTRSELQAYIDIYYDEYEDIEFEEPDFEDRDEYLEIVDRLKEIDSPYDVLDGGNDYDDIEWTDGIYEYEEYDIYPPDPMDSNYDEYFEFYQEYEDPDFDDNERRDFYNYVYEIEYYQNINGEDELDGMDLPHPEKIASNLGN